jgi:hypothetical protein
VVSRVDIEQKTIQFLKQYTGSVSKAVWPSSIRRCVARGKSRRRIMILKRFLLPHRLRTPNFLHTFNKMQVFCKHLIVTGSCTIHIIIVVIVGDIIEIMCMLDNWPILHFLTIICTTTTLIVIYLASSTLQRKHEYSYFFKNKFKVIGLRREERQLIEAKLAASSLASLPSIEHEDEEFEPHSVLISFPNTPMPKMPLIRVMETINLSSSNGEHLSTPQDLSLAKPTREEHCQDPDIFPQE